MRVLIACESSGTVREAFRRRGHDAWSCDLLPADDGSPYHLQNDALEVMYFGDWDLMIGHPPCTYLSSSGLHWNRRIPGRAEKTEAGLAFFRKFLDAPISRICVENPAGAAGTRIRPADQYIQPHDFGEDASKNTGLWLKNLPELVIDPALHVSGRMVMDKGKLRERWANQTDSGQNKLPPSDLRWKLRSKTYSGIAEAMAEQWGALPPLGPSRTSHGRYRKPSAT